MILEKRKRNTVSPALAPAYCVKRVFRLQWKPKQISGGLPELTSQRLELREVSRYFRAKY